MSLKQFLIQVVFGWLVFSLSLFLAGFNSGFGLGIFGEILSGIVIGVLIFRVVEKIMKSEYYREGSEEQ